MKDPYIANKYHQSTTSLVDPFGREIIYLRVAVTDRCNLRCRYCMPVSGLDWVPHERILTYEELFRLISNFVDLGIRKIRFTGGEPLVRKGLIDFIKSLDTIPKLDSIYLTTNGVLLHRYWKEIIGTKIKGINLSLDTLQRKRFISLCNKDALNDVFKSLSLMLNSNLKLKINSVIQCGFNEDEIRDLALLTEHNNIDLRFIEQMPFDGQSSEMANIFNKKKISEELRKSFPGFKLIKTKKTNAEIYQIPNFIGRIGIIDGYSRSFCNSCNRIRLTSTGLLKNCLYDNGVYDFKQLIKDGATDDDIKSVLVDQVKRRMRNGFEVENKLNLKVKDSMASIGG